MTNPTPGPWKLSMSGLAILDSEFKCEVATTLSPNNTYMPEVNKANAQLIADSSKTAAERDRLKALNAEMLAALKEVLGHTHEYVEQGDAYMPRVQEIIEYAIEKAEAKR